jgi:hypothetical protein
MISFILKLLFGRSRVVDQPSPPQTVRTIEDRERYRELRREILAKPTPKLK